ncbi:MAG: hypothetical protein WCA20_09360 [Candidatus Sulfotelmatobacter sp.]
MPKKKSSKTSTPTETQNPKPNRNQKLVPDEFADDLVDLPTAPQPLKKIKLTPEQLKASNKTLFQEHTPPDTTSASRAPPWLASA